MGVKDPHGPAGCPNNNATRKRAMDAWASRTRMAPQVATTHDTHRMESSGFRDFAMFALRRLRDLPSGMGA